jgi:hypothetical protein
VLYATLKRLGIHDRITGFGSLLERLASESAQVGPHG